MKLGSIGSEFGRVLAGCTGVLALGACVASCSAPAGEGLVPSRREGGPQVVFDLGKRPLPNVPLPNDLATRYDASSPTGRRLNVGLVARTKWESHLREVFDELDGFGVYAPISVAFSQPLDLQAIRARYANEDFRDDPLFVVNVDPSCSRFGEEVAVDVDRKLFPVILKEHGTPTTDTSAIVLAPARETTRSLAAYTSCIAFV